MAMVAPLIGATPPPRIGPPAGVYLYWISCAVQRKRKIQIPEETLAAASGPVAKLIAGLFGLLFERMGETITTEFHSFQTSFEPQPIDDASALVNWSRELQQRITALDREKDPTAPEVDITPLSFSFLRMIPMEIVEKRRAEFQKAQADLKAAEEALASETDPKAQVILKRAAYEARVTLGMVPRVEPKTYKCRMCGEEKVGGLQLEPEVKPFPPEGWAAPEGRESVFCDAHATNEILDALAAEDAIGKIDTEELVSALADFGKPLITPEIKEAMLQSPAEEDMAMCAGCDASISMEQAAATGGLCPGCAETAKSTGPALVTE